jgi:hypothetical protein
MTDRRPNPPVEEPRSEPEIIPPGGHPRSPQVPFSFILVILIAGLMSTALLVLMMGALLVALPAILLFVTVTLVVGLLRMYLQR